MQRGEQRERKGPTREEVAAHLVRVRVRGRVRAQQARRWLFITLSVGLLWVLTI